MASDELMAPVTQAQCNANVSRVLVRQDSQNEKLDHITGKIDKVLLAQEVQAKRVGKVEENQAVHRTVHSMQDKADERQRKDQADARSDQVLSMRKVGLLVTLVSMLVGGVLWAATNLLRPSVEEVARQVVSQIDTLGKDGPT